jgi:1-phosphatidylinositol-4-phosphate 5-kinase
MTLPELPERTPTVPMELRRLTAADDFVQALYFPSSALCAQYFHAMASTTLVESLRDPLQAPIDSKRTNSSYPTTRSVSQSHRSSYLGSSPSYSSSVNTPSSAPPVPEGINPIHQISTQPQEYHIVKVSKDRVQLETGPIPDTLVHKVGRSLSNAVTCGNADELETPSVTAGPFPPSPPASVAEVETVATNPPPSSQPHDMIMTDPEPGPSVTFLPRAQSSNFPPIVKGRTSVENKSFSSSRVSDDSSFPGPDGSPSKGDDGYLHPPPHFATRHPTRRNTTGSAPRPSGHGHHSTILGVEDGSGGELATDIQIQAEQILRERESRRLQQEYENSLVREKPPKPKVEDDGKPLVGNLIGEDHVNYVLMYNMLTGIRIGVRMVLFFSSGKHLIMLTSM